MSKAHVSFSCHIVQSMLLLTCIIALYPIYIENLVLVLYCTRRRYDCDLESPRNDHGVFLPASGYRTVVLSLFQTALQTLLARHVFSVLIWSVRVIDCYHVTGLSSGS